MSDLLMGCYEVIVIHPPQPVFTVQRPATSINIVLPVAGPPGPPGEDGSSGAASDASVAGLISNPSSQTYAALIPVIDDEIEVITEPAIDLVVLFNNSTA